MLTYPWKCTVLHCNHLGNTWKPLVLMTRHFDYCPSISEGDNQSVRSSAPVVSRCFPGGYNVKLYISRGRLAWWLLAFLHSDIVDLWTSDFNYCHTVNNVSILWDSTANLWWQTYEFWGIYNKLMKNKHISFMAFYFYGILLLLDSTTNLCGQHISFKGLCYKPMRTNISML